MIDYAEALTVFDVNSGSFVGRGKQARLEDTITRTNLEAAEEVVRQLRLRDIGGIIVIDFIDMARARNRDAVLKTLRKALDQDRTKTFTAEISKLGLVEMTRQNVTEGVREIISRHLPDVRRRRRRASEETVAIEFERKLRELAARAPRDAEAFLVQVQPGVEHRVHGPGRAHAARARGGDRQGLPLRGHRGLPLDHFAVVMEGSLEEVARARRALPARARRCSSRSSSRTCTTWTTRSRRSTATSSRSAGGGRYIGEKRLVRIEEAGRNSARATLVGAAPDDGEAASSEPAASAVVDGRRADGLESSLGAAAAEAGGAVRLPSGDRCRSGGDTPRD